MKRRLVSLVFVLAGALCLATRKPDPTGHFPVLVWCGAGLMITGVVIRLTARRS
jgi:protein tyrosine/serine phosphatase